MESNTTTPAQRTVRSIFEFVGNTVTLGNRHNLSPVSLRRIGAPIVAAIALTGFAGAGKDLIGSYQYSLSSNIPTSEKNINPKEYKLETIPNSGAFEFASHVDPSHDPRNGVDNFQEQLHHDPEPGDEVAVPVSTK